MKKDSTTGKSQDLDRKHGNDQNPKISDNVKPRVIDEGKIINQEKTMHFTNRAPKGSQ